MIIILVLPRKECINPFLALLELTLFKLGDFMCKKMNDIHPLEVTRP